MGRSKTSSARSQAKQAWSEWMDVGRRMEGSHPASALAAFDKAVASAQAADLPSEESAALLAGARCQLRTGELTSATIRAALCLAMAGPHEEEAVEALLVLAQAELDSGDMAQSAERCDEALRLAKSLGSQRQISRSLFAMARLQLSMENHQEAAALMRRSLEAGGEELLPSEQALALNALGHCLALPLLRGSFCRRLADWPEAQESVARLREAVSLSRAVGDHYIEFLACGNLHPLLQGTGELKEAARVYRRYLLLADRLDSPQVKARSLDHQGRFLAAQGRHRAALNRFQRAEALYDRLGHQTPMRLQLHLHACESCKEIGSFREAVRHLECIRSLERSMRLANAERRAQTSALVREADDARRENERLRKTNQALERKSQRLAKQSGHDSLTGIANRRTFEQRLRSLENQPVLSVLMMDLDHFKGVNDGYGHLIGDETLRRAAAILSRFVRETDLLARYGGEEFAILLPGATLHQAVEAGERIRRDVEAFDWGTVATGLKITVSVGAAQRQDAESLSACLHRADQALYQAKRTGRNRVHGCSLDQAA